MHNPVESCIIVTRGGGAAAPQSTIEKQDGMRGGLPVKLIIAIIQDEDASRLINELMTEGYRVTKLATTGGFLRAGNTTLLVGVEDDRLQKAMEVIERVCKSRKQIASTPAPISGTAGMYVPFPVEVTVGGATIFVLDVEQFTKI